MDTEIRTVSHAPTRAGDGPAEAFDVAVVGAGPTGLLVASELALAGVGVVVLDRRVEPDPTVKAGSINVATAEVLDRRGLRPAAQAAHRRTAESMAQFAAGLSGSPAGSSWQRQLDAHTDDDGAAAGSDRVGGGRASGRGGGGFPVTGHFAGILLRPDLVDQDDPRLQAHAGAAGSTLVRQADVEAILAEHADALGVAVRRGVEVTGLRQVSDPTDPAEGLVGVELDTSAGLVRAGWVVATDGGRSRLRHLLGVDFVGTDPETTGYQAIAEMTGAEGLRPGWNHTPTGVYSYGPLPGRILTVQFDGGPDRARRDEPVTREEVEASVRLVTGADVRVTALHGPATRWSDNARQATSYRVGRVLLAGDAAHVHSPFSGQGLNLGAGDATNLGWKLAATVRGWAPAGLLDTYHDERHPVGAWVLDWTRAQVALMRTDPKSAQLHRVVEHDLLTDTATMTDLVLQTSGVAQSYDLGPGSAGHTDCTGDDGAARAVSTAARPLAGRLVGDVQLSDGSRLADHAHDGRSLLLDRTRDGALAAAAAGWSARVTTVLEPRPAPGGPALYEDVVGLLVRPDGVIAWSSHDTGDGPPAGDGSSVGEPATAGLVRALRRWAGEPDTAA